jgi:hypothetical protein
MTIHHFFNSAETTCVSCDGFADNDGFSLQELPLENRRRFFSTRGFGRA